MQDDIVSVTNKSASQSEPKAALSQDPSIHNMKYVAIPSPDEVDEQAASGSASDPDSDNDTLQNAQMMGMQLEEDSENPEEIDIARDINKAEQALRDQ